jgi:hypothetical protein
MINRRSNNGAFAKKHQGGWLSKKRQMQGDRGNAAVDEFLRRHQ